VFWAGALAIPVAAVGIALGDIVEASPLSAGQWVGLVALFLALTGVYALQAAIAYRMTKSRRLHRRRESATALAGGGRFG
jgi:hypothetical protein